LATDITQPAGLGPESSRIRALWPYAAFLLIVLVYSLLFLADGYNGTDEGYLQSLAQRILDGQRPYVDFYYLRPPLSIYIQAGLLKLFGDSYTILVGRWFWTLQMVVLCLMLSVVYRRTATNVETFLLLCTTWVVSSLLIQFPWYSYDAAFFAVAAVAAIHKRWYVAAGLAMFLAAMSKQNYLLLFPGFILVAWVVQWRNKEAERVKARQMIGLVLGFVVPMVAYLWHLSSYNAVGVFLRDMFILPGAISETSTTFTLVQNNPEAFLKALPSVVTAACLLLLARRNKVCYAFAFVASATAVAVSFISYHWFVYQLIFFNYVLLLVPLIWILIVKKGQDRPLLNCLWPVIVLSLIVQYASGFNYAGVVFGYMGVAPGLCVGWLLLRRAGSPAGRRAAALLIPAVILAVGLFHKVDFMAGDDKRWRLDAEFTAPKLAGIRSTKRNVDQIEGLLDVIDHRTQPGDYIVVFPDFPGLYYLSRRRDPMKVGWFTLREFNLRMIRESVARCDSLRPKLVFLQTYGELDWRRVSRPLPYGSINRWRPFIDWLFTHYKKLDMVGDIAIFVPTATYPNTQSAGE